MSKSTKAERLTQPVGQTMNNAAKISSKCQFFIGEGL